VNMSPTFGCTILTPHGFTFYKFGTAMQRKKAVLTLLLNNKCEIFLYPGLKAGFKTTITQG